jgi:hypothetical protein
MQIGCLSDDGKYISNFGKRESGVELKVLEEDESVRITRIQSYKLIILLS